MNIYSWFQLIFYIVVLLALAKPLGSFMAKVYQGEHTFLDPCAGSRGTVHLSPLRCQTRRGYELEDLCHRRDAVQCAWLARGVCLAEACKAFLPLNPQGLGAVTPDSSWNTAISFATNTNWQGYGGEVTMSYLSQMLGLTVQNFVSAATGMAVLIALIRGIVRHTAKGIGNFWVDLTRSTLYILLPLSIVVALALVSQGVVQTFSPYKTVTLLQPTTDANGNAVTEQVLAVGPAASQIAIKQLGTNGGGFFNVNSAHPFENATPFSNFVEMLSILVISGALVLHLRRDGGRHTPGLGNPGRDDDHHGGVPGVWRSGRNRAATRPSLRWVWIKPRPDINPGGNMEGKETRFGIANSALWATVTTAASNGSVNSMHDSFMPLGGLVPLFMMQLGEIIFGGVGSGLYGMLAFVIVAVFVAGLMVGRTPEYLGKKIEAYEMKMASLMLLIPILLVKVGTAIAVVAPAGLATIWNTGGPHGFSEVLYAFSSAANNNGSAFAGLGANTPFYNTALGICMFFARYWLIVPALAIAGSLVQKKKVPASSGTLPTHTPLFVAWLIGVIMIVGALSFIPALALGPIVEHLMVFAHIEWILE